MSHPAPSDKTVSSIPSRPAAEDGGINLLRLVNIAVRHIWLIVGVSGVFAVIALVSGLTSGRTWSSDATFIPQGSRGPSTVSSLAAQFGISSAGPEAGQSPQFYVDLVGTREVRRGVVRATYTIHTDTGTFTGDLVKLMGPTKRPTNNPEESVMRMLNSTVSAAPSVKTGVITMRAVSPYRELPAQILRSFFEQINRFNQVGRQSRVSAERKFTEERLHEAQDSLTAAEDAMEEFLRSNRDLGSPSLQLRKERLNRVVLTRQQVYTALAQSYEQSKIEELRDTPAITVIDPPVIPTEPNPRGTIGKTAKSLIFGALMGTILAFLLDYFERSGGRESAGYQEFVHLLRNAFSRPFRRKAR